jgi:hypothetical protein
MRACGVAGGVAVGEGGGVRRGDDEGHALGAVHRGAAHRRVRIPTRAPARHPPPRQTDQVEPERQLALRCTGGCASLPDVHVDRSPRSASVSFARTASAAEFTGASALRAHASYTSLSPRLHTHTHATEFSESSCPLTFVASLII